MSHTNAGPPSLSDRTAALGQRLHALPALPTLEGAHARLRAPRDGDAPAVFALFSDPDTMRWWSRPPMRRLDEAEAYIESIRRGFERRELLNWLIADRDDDRVIGSCTLYALQVPHLRAGLGYALLRERVGRGLASEAVAMLLDFAFGELGFHRIEANVHPHNERSRRMLERLGFRLEGVFREHFVVGDELQDSAIHGLLAPQWRQDTPGETLARQPLGESGAKP